MYVVSSDNFCGKDLILQIRMQYFNLGAQESKWISHGVPGFFVGFLYHWKAFVTQITSQNFIFAAQHLFKILIFEILDLN